MDRDIFPVSLSLILTVLSPHSSRNRRKPTITCILISCLLFDFFFYLYILYSPLLALFQLVFPMTFWESQQSPQWPVCLAFCVSFAFITYNSLIIYFEGTYGLAFWRTSPYGFPPTSLSVHIISECIAITP